MNNGEIPTNALYGVLNMLRSTMLKISSERIAVIFDAKGKTFRNNIYPAYKANRPSMPENLRCQIKPLHNIIRAMGLPLISISGVEADDVIGTLATQACNIGIPVVISTIDKDMSQLVNENIFLINTKTNTIIDRKNVVRKFGIPPELIIDYLALVGDKIDNVPGVPGIGNKTARALLQKIGGLKKLFNHLDDIETLNFRGSKTIAEKLIKNKDSAMLSYELASIKLDVKIAETPESLIKTAPHKEDLLKLYKQLALKSWFNELIENKLDSKVISNKKVKTQTILLNNNTAHISTSKTTLEHNSNYQTILDKNAFLELLNQLKTADIFSFDMKADDLNYMISNPIGFSFSTEEGMAAYIPVAHDYLNSPKQLNSAWVLSQLKPILEDENQAKVGHNIKNHVNTLARYGVKLRGIKHDTMLASYVLNTADRHNIDSLAHRFLQYRCIPFTQIAGKKGKKQLTFNQVNLRCATQYAAERTDLILRLHKHILNKIERNEKLQNIYQNIEIPLILVLSRIECTGVLIDNTLLTTESDKIKIQLNELEQKTYAITKQKFNINSSKQLQMILFEKMGLPVLKKTPLGMPSTSEEVLQELALNYLLPQLVLKYRSLAKLKSTYTDKLPKMIHPKTGRIHTSYHQETTITGRLSSTDPNIQNIPVRNKQGRRIRQAFIAPHGYKILSIDYSQIELRIIAHLSGDKTLSDAFKQGKDIHTATAADMIGINIEQVSSKQRQHAKTVNFGLIYGMSAFGLSKQLHIPYKKAQEYINIYFERYSGVMKYMEEVCITAFDRGFVETVFKRRVYLPRMKSKNNICKKAVERMAINAPIQGTAADIIKKAMLLVDKWIQDAGCNRIKLLMQVHDELVFEIQESALDEMTYKIQQLMESATKLNVPLITKVGYGDNWDQAH
ncbi:DNA polymerase I [Candidatus Photodesmus blepharus]|uniref:DNA polymerase I n=2 Tax=Candidatus Photodesmus blepharonis TaxID=1179155 RepID=A0A084CNS5_9GAMM|nr:DNA polymerase I [Candidatus Photodesmus blepharus]